MTGFNYLPLWFNYKNRVQTDLGYCVKKSKAIVLQACRQTVVVITSRLLYSRKLPVVPHFSHAVYFPAFYPLALLHPARPHSRFLPASGGEMHYTGTILINTAADTYFTDSSRCQLR